MVARAGNKLAVGRRLPRERIVWFPEQETNSRIKALQYDLHIEADNLEKSGKEVCPSVYASLFRRCGNAQALEIGRKVHSQIPHTAACNGSLGNLLVQMYGKCGSVEDARKAFEYVHPKTPFTYNLMLGAYAHNGHHKSALDFFTQIQSAHRNRVSFSIAINVCGNTGNLEFGRKIHKQMIESGLEIDDVLGTCIINMYGKCRSTEDARSFFYGMKNKCLVAYNTMLSIYILNECSGETIDLFRRMLQSEVHPDSVSYTNVFRACTLLENLREGRAFHERFLSSGLECDVVLGNTLIKMYSICGSVAEARKVFDHMPEKNNVTWTNMAITYTQAGHLQEAMELYGCMNLQGVRLHRLVIPCFITACYRLEQGKEIHARALADGLEHETAIGNALIAMYGRFGQLDEAKRVFDSTPQKTVISWTSMIAANAQNGGWSEALSMFQSMKTAGGIAPNYVTCLIMLDACSECGTLSNGRAIHREIKYCGLDKELKVNNTLVNMYGKCGSLRDARGVFDGMHERNLVSWTSMLAAYCHQGHGCEALELYRNMEMEGVALDNVAYVSVLSALSHAGLVHDCWLCFTTMTEGHEIHVTVEIYNCIIDLLGRAGWLKDAQDLLENMPFEPAYKEWMTFLGSCKTHGDWQRGAIAAERAVELRGEVAQPYIMLLATIGTEEDDEESI